MNLQFGYDKCEKVYIGKTHNKDICPDLSVDSWKEQISENENGKLEMKDIYDGRKI